MEFFEMLPRDLKMCSFCIFNKWHGKPVNR